MNKLIQPAPIRVDLLDCIDNQEFKKFLRIVQNRCGVKFLKTSIPSATEAISHNQIDPCYHGCGLKGEGWVQWTANIPAIVGFDANTCKEELAATLLHEFGHISNGLRWRSPVGGKGTVYSELQASRWALRIARRYGALFGIDYEKTKDYYSKWLSEYCFAHGVLSTKFIASLEKI